MPVHRARFEPRMTRSQAKEAAQGGNMSAEYAALMGGAAAKSNSGLPTPMDVANTFWDKLSKPFYDNGPNDKGIGIQLAYSLARVMIGFFFAALVAVPLGFLVGMSPVMHRALNPFIQLLKPISPLAWMPLARSPLRRFLIDLRMDRRQSPRWRNRPRTTELTKRMRNGSRTSI